MTQPSDSVPCFNESMYHNDGNNKNEWSKSKPMNFTEQMEKWIELRQSLYSKNGWCSTNVNQVSKWDVGYMQKHSHETGSHLGTNIWNTNLSQPTSVQPRPIVPRPDGDAACYNPQLAAEWKNKGAIPKMFNLGNFNCLSVNATNLSPSQPPQRNATVFQDCDNIESTTENDDDVNLALRLQLETMNLDANFCNEHEHRPPNLNQLTNICQIPKQYQVDCSPPAFS